MIIQQFTGDITIWNIIAWIVDLAMVAIAVNYCIIWLYARMGWNKNGKKSKK